MVRNSGRRILSGIAGIALALLSQQSIAQGVFLDPILHEAVRVDLVSLGADPGVAIEADEMVGVGFTSFTNNSGLIFNLTGLEYATDLVDLDLASNRIYDVTPLASLKNLQVLSLAMNGNTIEPEWLSDYTPLAKLINLTELDVAFNHVIEDLSFVQDLVNLTKLDASFNKIENLGPLLNLTNLTELYLGFNEIKNVSTLGALPNLNTVELVYNEITDITPLTENIGLTADDTIFLAHNPLSANALCIELSALDARRVILDISSDCTAFTEQEYADVILGITIPDQPTLAAMDLNADYEVNVADLIRFLNGGVLTTVPDVIGDTLAEAKEQIEDVSNLILGSKIASTPVVRIPAVQVLAQDSAGFAIPEKSEVNVTVSIPPDPFNFLTMGTGISDSKGRQQAEAYYLAIDPLNQKDTLPKWIAENGYGQPGGVEAEAVYFSSFDLGLGRHMYMRQDAGNTAYYVTNHDTVDDVWQSAANPLATVAMEYSPGPSGGEPYVKFYTFDQFGQRVVDVNLDGRGERYQPSMCMTCHGGQPKTLVNGIYPDEGNTGARFVPFDLEALSYSEKNARYTRAPQEDEFKKFNRAVVDHLVELQAGDGTIELIEGWYGGEGLPDDFNGDYVPSSWSDESILYLDVIAQSCRSCHLQQTTSDFTTLTTFSTHNAKTIKHVFEQGVMPNALKTYQDFWLSTSPHRPALLAEFLGISDVSPGNPLASLGFAGDTSVEGNIITLIGNNSIFANEYEWSFTSVPNGSAVTDSSFLDRFASTTTFTPDVSSDGGGGNYEIQLIVRKAGLSDTGTMSLAINPPPSQSFTDDIVPIFQSGGLGCISCHDIDLTASPSFEVDTSNSGTITATRHNIFLALTDDVSPAYGEILVDTNDSSSSVILYVPSMDPDFAGVHEPGIKLPKGGTEYNKIKWWIEQGALEDNYTPPTISFATEIVPIFQNCVGCHTSALNYGNLNLNQSNHLIYLELTVEESAWSGATRTDLVNPTNSLILTKPTTTVSHDGGFMFSNVSTAYNKLLTWIQEGTLEN